MDTVNNIASAAARAVWGEDKQHGDEPVSGQTGNTSKGEPYDAGNIEENTTQTTKPQTNGTASDHSAAQFSKNTGTAAEHENTPDNPSTELKTKAPTQNDSTKGQEDVRDPENPMTNPKSAPTDVDDTGDGPNEAQKLEGPGPKPVEEVAREHGGDAGKSENTEHKAPPGDDKEAEEAEDEDGPNAKSKGEGTGEQYIKTSGLKADGGDFDATKPGAGREADRLMEEKGLHPGSDDAEDDGDTKSKEKKGLGQKIKDKLHRH
ncbi:hypothetical protein F5B20DRAFT_27238 [Whalleya microplaca]|nr:hypothetical protein F5B20DRAFT_27238 [Whalleya microplaca]